MSRQRNRRRLSIQSLETRKLMAGDVQLYADFFGLDDLWTERKEVRTSTKTESESIQTSDSSSAAEEGGGLWNSSTGTLSFQAVDSVMGSSGSGGGILNHSSAIV